MQEIKKIQVYIHNVPKGRGIRCAIGFQEANDHYYGWYIGYSGGGCQQERYFKLSKDLKEIKHFDGDEDGLGDTEISIEEEKIMHGVWCEVTNFFNSNDESWTTIAPENLNKFSVHGEIYHYETKGFLDKVLHEVSKHWCLLTSYFPYEDEGVK